MPYLADAGVLEPLDAFAPGGAREDFDLVPALAQARGFAGGDERPLVALPFNRSTPIAYYNKAVFRDLGLAPPTTWEELREVAARATRGSGRDRDRWGFECPIDWWFWLALVGQAGGSLLAADGTPTLGGESGVQALELWQTLVHRDAHHEAAAGPRLQRLAGRQHRLPLRARRDDLDLHRVPPLPGGQRALRGRRRAAPARRARLGAHRRHAVRDAQGPARAPSRRRRSPSSAG